MCGRILYMSNRTCHAEDEGKKRIEIKRVNRSHSECNAKPSLPAQVLPLLTKDVKQGTCPDDDGKQTMFQIEGLIYLQLS